MNIRCQRCGRVLTDPLSRALRLGPECRGGSRPATRRQVRAHNRVLRGVAYAEKTTIKIGQALTYQYDPKDNTWKSEKETIPHQRFGEWLARLQMIIPPADHLQILKNHKATAAQILKESRSILDRDQVQLIKCELTQLKSDIQKFSLLVKGGSHAKALQAKRR